MCAATHPLPQLRHDGINPGVPSPSLGPRLDKLGVVVPVNLPAHWVPRHAGEVGRVGPHLGGHVRCRCSPHDWVRALGSFFIGALWACMGTLSGTNSGMGAEEECDVGQEYWRETESRAWVGMVLAPALSGVLLATCCVDNSKSRAIDGGRRALKTQEPSECHVAPINTALLHQRIF